MSKPRPKRTKILTDDLRKKFENHILEGYSPRSFYTAYNFNARSFEFYLQHDPEMIRINKLYKQRLIKRREAWK